MAFKQLDLQLPPSAIAAPLARRQLGRLASEVPESALEVVELLVTELVANSVRHADLSDDHAIRLSVRFSDDLVRVEVCDPGSGFEPHVALPGTDETGGRGLFLVDQLSDGWGVDVRGGSRVWFIVGF